MSITHPSAAKLFGAAILLAAAPLGAQGLPATNPTTIPATPSATPPISPPPPAARPNPPTHLAQVVYSGRLLTVTADNSSLNQILRDISRATGMKITGGVNEERVFGTYGPADPSSILATLLNGTGSNMLLTMDAGLPRELILTPRQGGPTPPNPNSYREEPRQPERLPIYAPNEAPNYPQNPLINRDNPPPPGGQAGSLQTTPTTPTNGTPAPAATTPDNTTTQQSPNGVKTPQQIYEELLKMQPKTTPPPQ